MPIFFIYHFSRLILQADPSTLERMSYVLVGSRVLLSLGFPAALFQAELFAGAVRGRLLEQLLPRPSPQQWRDAVAVALDDPPARIGFWDPATHRYREPDGTELAAPEPASGRSRVEAHRGAQPVAAMVIDNALAEDPELVRAATSATVLAVQHGNLELQRFGAEVDRVLEEVRTAATGVAPPELARHGVAAALTSLTGSGVLPVTVQERGFGRRSEAVETTVFFCCAEALQNAAKHAGAHASANVILSDGWVQFSVEDDGAGFDPDTAARGHGLRNLNDRLAAAGGSLTLDTGQGHGTRVSGRLSADI